MKHRNIPVIKAIDYVDEIMSGGKITTNEEYGRWNAMKYLLREVLRAEREEIEYAYSLGGHNLSIRITQYALNKVVTGTAISPSKYLNETYVINETDSKEVK